MSSNLPTANKEQNVDRIVIDDREIVLVGTAHVSTSSVTLVEHIIEAERPNSVAIELCEGRFLNLRDPDRWRNTDLAEIIRKGKSYVLLAQLLLASFQRKIGDRIKVKPGAEMLAAAQSADRIGAHIALADRDISLTLKRAWRSLGIRGILRLTTSLITSFVEKPAEISEEEIERLKSSDVLNEVMKEFSDIFPEVRAALIDERDRYLAQKIREAPGHKVVAVVGAAHVPGIKNYIQSDTDLSEISQIPPRSALMRAFSWLIPVLVVGGMGFALLDSGTATFAEMFKEWFWITGLAGAIGAAVMLAHPITIVVGFFSAPWAAINPFLAAGWVTGLTEAIIRKPRVKDLETIAQDIGSVRGLFGNRVSRTLLLVATTNLAVMAGMVVATKRVITIAAESSAPAAATPTQTPPAM